MKTIAIKKANELKGSVKISGSKNAAIPILCTSIIARKKIVLKNVPKISDLKKIIKILRYLNCKVKIKTRSLIIDSSNIEYKSLAIKECSQFRGSYYFIPVFLYLFDKCDILLPGGCNIGSRPIDAHLDVFNSFGYKCVIENDHLWVRKDLEVKEPTYKMIKPSVGASINAIITALKCDYAIIDDLVLEPEALDLISFLKKLGFDLDSLKQRVVYRGYKESTEEIIKHRIIPDRIEAMTFIIMGLLCGDIKVKGANIDHFRFPLDLLIENGFNIKIKRKYLRCQKSRGNCFDIKTEIYPFFPTDMQPLFGVLLAYARGSCVIEETIFERRMDIFENLNDLGASVNIIGNKAYIIGSEINKPINFICKDLRHSAALMLLLLKNGGCLNNIEIINRGYDAFFYKIRMLGCNFKLK